MQLSLSLRRSAALAGAAALLALPQVAAAATEVTLDDSVTATIENAEGVQAHGALDADPFTYTVKSRVKCEEPYVDGARTVFVQGEGEKAIRVVMSGIDSLEKDGTVVNPIDASFVDVAAEGAANLQIECVKIDNGIPQPAPQAIVQPLTITKEEWKMEGVSFKEAAPEEPSNDAPGKQPTDSASTPAVPEPDENDQEAPNTSLRRTRSRRTSLHRTRFRPAQRTQARPIRRSRPRKLTRTIAVPGSCPARAPRSPQRQFSLSR